MPISRTGAALIVGVMWVVFAGGCPRPYVDVDEAAGAAGEFCVTPDDCTGGLSCLENNCCSNDSCGSVCSSLMEKDGTAASTVGRHPAMDRFARRKCLALCCQGADTGRIERVLAAWASQVPAHGITPQANAP